MPLTFYFDVQNAPEVLRALEQLPVELEKKVLRRAFRDAQRPMLAQIRANLMAMRVTGEHSDKIRRGLKLRALKRKRGRFGVAIMTPTREELGIPATDKWYYPAHIELGTRRTTAKPYMRNAFKTKGQETLETLRQAILDGIERLHIKGARG